MGVGWGRCSLCFWLTLKLILTEIPSHLRNLVTGTRKTDTEKTFCSEALFHCGLQEETYLHSCTKAFCWEIYTSIGICIKQLMILWVLSVVEHRSFFPLEQSYLLWIITSSLRDLAAPWRGGPPPQLPPLDTACSCPWTPKLPPSRRPGGPCDQPVPSVKQFFLGSKLHYTHRGACITCRFWLVGPG